MATEELKQQRSRIASSGTPVIVPVTLPPDRTPTLLETEASPTEETNHAREHWIASPRSCHSRQWKHRDIWCDRGRQCDQPIGRSRQWRPQ